MENTGEVECPPELKERKDHEKGEITCNTHDGN